MPTPPWSLHRLQRSLCSDAWSTSSSSSLTLMFTGMCDVLLFLKYILIQVPPPWLTSPAVSCSGPIVELTGTIYVVFSQRPTLQLTAAKMGAQTLKTAENTRIFVQKPKLMIFFSLVLQSGRKVQTSKSIAILAAFSLSLPCLCTFLQLYFLTLKNNSYHKMVAQITSISSRYEMLSL